MSAPTPAVMAKFRRPAQPIDLTRVGTEPAPEPKKAPVVLAVQEPSDPGKIVRPGRVPKMSEGVIKAKQVQPGQVVRAFLHGKPVGSERTVEKTRFDKETGLVTITFSSAHPTTTYKAAYRFFVKNLIVHEPALVAYKEV